MLLDHIKPTEVLWIPEKDPELPKIGKWNIEGGETTITSLSLLILSLSIPILPIHKGVIPVGGL